MIRFLLDTDLISEPAKPRASVAVLDKLRVHEAECAIASLSWHEILFGVERLATGARRRQLERFLRERIEPWLPILPYDDNAAEWHAIERARLVRSGRTPPFVDGQIAAIAAVNNLVLVTFNTDDYRYFDDLLLADWRTP